jgi:molybdenum transport protein
VILVPIADADIDRLISEDVGFGDLTTASLSIGHVPAIIRFTARHPLVACATEEAARIFVRLGARISAVAPSGDVAEPGAVLLEAGGSAAALHAGWKVAQTLVEWASGIASAVHDICRAATSVNPRVAVACTRKAAPLSRALAIKAVRAGGGTMHRTGLSDTILVFPEHRAFLPDRGEAALVAQLRAAAPERKIVVEITDVASARRFAAAGVDVLQLEKFAAAQVAELAAAIAALPRRPVVAAAGGINAANAADYAKAGADVLVTSWPYAAGPRDVQVKLGPG